MRSSLNVNYDYFFQFVFAKKVNKFETRLLDAAQLTSCAKRARRYSGLCGPQLTNEEATRNAEIAEEKISSVREENYENLVDEIKTSEGSISSKAIKSLKKVSEIGGYFMLGFM
uniref:Uncharacterized protein n=1 Tax=Romanomermis culicivorax TaxID=13658 RepID=A0A915J632_ROMCU